MSNPTASEDQKPADPQPNAQPPAGAQNTEEQSVPFSRFKEVNAAKKQLEERLAKIEADAEAQRLADEKARRDAEAEQGNFKQAHAQAEAELEKLRPLARQAETYRKTFETMLTGRLEKVPEHIRTLLEKMEPVAALEWLDANSEQLQPRQAPPTDAGKTGERGAPKVDVNPKPIPF